MKPCIAIKAESKNTIKMDLNYGILSKREYNDQLIQRVKHTGWARPRRRGEEMEEQKNFIRTKYMELKKTLITR